MGLRRFLGQCAAVVAAAVAVALMLLLHLQKPEA